MKQTLSEDELLTLVDEHDSIIGNIHRSVAHKNKNFIHRIVAIIIYKDKDMLIHKRSMNKDVLPGCWDLSAAGHVGYGQDYLEAAKTELYEEIGIKASEKDLKPLKKLLIRSSWETEYCQIYKYHLKKNDNLKISEEEIDEVKFVSPNELETSLKSRKYRWNPKTRKLFRDLRIVSK